MPTWRTWTRAVPLAGALALATTGCLHEVISHGSGIAGRVAINNRGSIAGTTGVQGIGHGHAFIQREGGEPELIDGDATESTVAALNEDDVVVGTVGRTAPGDPEGGHPFRWSPDTGLEHLPLPPGMFGASAVDVNATGTILVTGYPTAWTDTRGRPFLWDPATSAYTELPTARSDGDFATAINDAGVVVGAAGVRPGEGYRAVFWDAATHALHQLDDQGALASAATAINDAGMIAGDITSPAGPRRAALWSTVDSAPQLATNLELAHALNESGVVVGQRELLTANGARQPAALWDPSAGFEEDLGDDGRGYAMADDINDTGTAVGLAGPDTDHPGGPLQVVRWDPYTRGS
jgi:uncharacterized membrane protein